VKFFKEKLRIRVILTRFSWPVVGATCYFILAAMTIWMTSNGRNPATVWPADAVILALLLIHPQNKWPTLVLAGWVANFLANGMVRGWAAGYLLYGAINMSQVVIVAWFIGIRQLRHGLLENASSVGRFILWGGLIAPLIGSLLGSLVAMSIYGQPFGASFERWFASNALGFLVATPFFTAVFDGSFVRDFQSRTIPQRRETLTLLGGYAALAVFVLNQSRLPLLFVPVSALVLLSFRIGRLGTQIAVVISAIAGMAATNHSVGPFSLIPGDTFVNSVFYQFYLAVLLATALPVAAIVSSRSETLTRFAEREETLRQIMAHSSDGILSLDAKGICRWAGGPLEQLIGLDAESLTGRTLHDLPIHDKDVFIAMDFAATSERGAPQIVELRPILRPDVTLEALISPMQREGVSIGTVVTLHNISVRKANELSLTQRAYIDDLTGIYNRAGFYEQLDAMLAKAQHPLSLVLIDIDHFKTINDTHGHLVGDGILCEIARRLAAEARNIDVIGRIGGDEFAIMMCNDALTSRTACERILQAVSNKVILAANGKEVLTSISCGIAEFRPGWSRRQLFEAADTALYAVKQNGRNGARVAA